MKYYLCLFLGLNDSKKLCLQNTIVIEDVNFFVSVFYKRSKM